MTQDNNNTYGIEKFDGSFEKEEGGCSIVINSTVNSIKNLDVSGLYIYLMCRPSGWKLHPKQLAAHFGCNKDKIYKCLNILMEINLLSRTDSRHIGKFTKPNYLIHLHPHSPCLEKPDTVKPDTKNTDTYKTKKISIKEKEEEINKGTSDEDACKVALSSDKSPKKKKFGLEQLEANNPHGIATRMLEDWLEVRRNKRTAVTETAWNKINRNLALIDKEAKIAPVEAFERMVASGWQSLEVSYFLSSYKSPKKTHDWDDMEWSKGMHEDIL